MWEPASRETALHAPPLSCTSLADGIRTDSHCLIPDFDTANRPVETGKFKGPEPEPLQNLRGVHPRIETATTWFSSAQQDS